MVETYRHNMDGNVRQLFVDSFSSPGMKYCILSMKTSLRNDSTGDVLGIPSPSIKTGITVYSKSADDSLSVLLLSVYGLLPLSRYCNHFPF